MDMSTLDFNYFDAVIASIVIILGIKGMMNGFIKEFFGLVGLVGGVYIAARMAHTAGEFIDKNLYHMENSTVLQLVGFIAILALVWIDLPYTRPSGGVRHRQLPLLWRQGQKVRVRAQGAS